MDKDTRSLGGRYKEIYAGAETHHSDRYDTQLTDVVDWLRNKGFYLRDPHPGHRDPVYGADEAAFFYIGYNRNEGFYGSSDKDASLYQGPEGVIITVIIQHLTAAKGKRLVPQLSVEVKKFQEWKMDGYHHRTVRQNSFQTVYYKSLYMWTDDTQWAAIDEVLDYAWNKWEHAVEEMTTDKLTKFDF